MERGDSVAVPWLPRTTFPALLPLSIAMERGQGLFIVEEMSRVHPVG
jgi:hypothetical protein